MDSGREKTNTPVDESGAQAPVDRRRIALLNGAGGQADRIRISGQIVDIPLTATQKSDEWDSFNSLPQSQRTTIRPIQDFGMSGVRRARLQLEIIEDGEEARLNPDGGKTLFTTPVFTTNNDSFFQKTLDCSPPPGRYLVRVIYRGIESLRQSISDLSYIGDNDSYILKKDIPIGYGRLHILPKDYRGLILISDIDQTFLETRIDSQKGLMTSLFESPREKKPIAGMPELYRQILRGMEYPLPLHFISAAPHFYRRTLRSLFQKHQIDYTGLHLKYLLGTVDGIVRKVIRSIINFDELLTMNIAQAIERSMKFIGSSLDSLFDHISYKLTMLLENRLMQPTGSQEILIGDNTESDYFVFVLYQYLLTGILQGEELENYLYNLNFRGRESLTRDHALRICELAGQNLELHGPVNPVAEVWINLAYNEREEHLMQSATDEALPQGKKLQDEAAAGIISLKAYYGSPGLALLALERDLITLKGFARVWASLDGAVFRNRPLNTETLQTIMQSMSLKKYSPNEILNALS